MRTFAFMLHNKKFIVYPSIHRSKKETISKFYALLFEKKIRYVDLGGLLH